MPIWRGNTYRFTVTAANATANATYINNGFTFTVTDTIAAGTVLFCTGTGAPTASGTLTRTSGTGDATITFSANTAPNTNWGTSTNWLTDGSGAGVPTVSTDAVFDNISSNCTVNVVSVCRNLNFNSGTGYTATIDMANQISVGTAAAGGQAITLSPGMGITGTSPLRTIAAGTTTTTKKVRGKNVVTVTPGFSQERAKVSIEEQLKVMNPDEFDRKKRIDFQGWLSQNVAGA